MKLQRFPREKYLNRIRPFYNDYGIIKVLSGVRRCGKSCLLECIEDELVASGIPSENIIIINLDKRPYMRIKSADQLDEIINERTKNINGLKYLFIDEIQNVKNFEEVINGYREENEFSIFITGSNSYLLSGELITKLTGRYIEFKINTLSFDEYIDMKKFFKKNINLNLDIEFEHYIREGGFPKAIEYDDFPSKQIYTKSVIDEIYEKDIKKNRKIKNKRLFDEIIKFIISNFGATISIDSLVNYINSNTTEKTTKITIYKYIQQLESLKIIEKCSRIDQKSKRALFGKEKYYLTDLSFYFYNRTDNKINYGPVLENIVYNYLKGLGYQISVGKLKEYEIDFVLRDINDNYSYVQVARTIDNGIYDNNGASLVEEREYRPLEMIKDNYPKYVLTLDHLIQKRNGIIHKNIVDFISKKEDL